jgi:BASS family bile acid:Na+ symporter
MRETLLATLKLLVSIAIPLAAFLTGLRAAEAGHGWLWKRRPLLGRSLLAILVVVPVGTLVLLEILGPPDLVKNGLLVAILAVGIGPATALKRTKSAEERVPYEVGLNIALLVSSIVFLPLAETVHAWIFQHQIRLGPGQVAAVVLPRAVLPMALGVAVARLFPGTVGPVARYGGPLVNVVLLAVLLFALVVGWRAVMGVGIVGWLTSIAVAVMAVAVGHALGGPDRSTRAVLAAYSATRFPALALLLISMVPGGRRLLPTVLVYFLCSAVVVAGYGALLAARERRRHGPLPAPARA